MKKLLSLLLSLLIVTSFIGCGEATAYKEQTKQETTVQEENKEQAKEEPKQEAKEEPKEEIRDDLPKNVDEPEEPKKEEKHYKCSECGATISEKQNTTFRGHCPNCVKCLNCGKITLQTLKDREYDGVPYTRYCDSCYEDMIARIAEDNKLREESRRKEEQAQKQAQEEQEHYDTSVFVCSSCGWNSHMSGQEYMYTHNKNGDAYNLDPNCDKCEKCGGQMVESY